MADTKLPPVCFFHPDLNAVFSRERSGIEEKVSREKQVNTDIVPHSKSGLVPRSSLLGAGQLGFRKIGEGGTMGEGRGK
jgi:hypothetical protein